MILTRIFIGATPMTLKLTAFSSLFTGAIEQHLRI